MDIDKLISELHQERARLDAAIDALERISAGGGKRRGRPPKWLSKIRAEGGSTDGDGHEPERPGKPPKK